MKSGTLTIVVWALLYTSTEIAELWSSFREAEIFDSGISHTERVEIWQRSGQSAYFPNLMNVGPGVP